MRQLLLRFGEPAGSQRSIRQNKEADNGNESGGNTLNDEEPVFLLASRG